MGKQQDLWGKKAEEKNIQGDRQMSNRSSKKGSKGGWGRGVGTRGNTGGGPTLRVSCRDLTDQDTYAIWVGGLLI